MKDIFCPACRHHLNDASHVGGENIRPSPGDISVCLYCMAALVYTDGAEVRLMSEEERKSLPPDLVYQLSKALTVSVIHRAAFPEKKVEKK